MIQLSYADTLQMLVGLRGHTSRPSGDEQVAFLKYCLEHTWHSRGQFLQDLWVAYELRSRRNGFFVEFGGADGVKASNSFYLETELGWTGVIAEPARGWWPALRHNRACAIETRCVWRETGARLAFTETPIGVHSTLEQFAQGDLHAATRVEGERYEVETVSLQDMLDFWRAPRRIDYLSVDTEGSEFEILQAFDFGAYDVRLITVEHNHTENRDKLFTLLTAKGYRRKFEQLSGVDDWYVKVD